jgi:hypothetical protein
MFIIEFSIHHTKKAGAKELKSACYTIALQRKNIQKTFIGE